MTDAERLDAMRAAADAIMTKAGVPDDQYRLSVYATTRMGIASSGVRVESWVPDRDQGRWTIGVNAPEDIEDHHWPADLQVRGHVTPLCLAVLNAIDALFWEDRER